MLVIDSPRLLKASYFVLPYQHWTHLALDSQDTVSICFLPHQISEDGNFVADTLPEIVVSPIDFERWRYVYRLSGYLKDRSGLLSDIGRVISNYNLNILCSESAVTEHQRFHYFEMLIDIGAMAVHADIGDQISRFEWSLKAELLDDLTFSVNQNIDQPRIKFRPVLTLHQAKKAFDSLKANPYFDSELPPVAQVSKVQKEMICNYEDLESALSLKIKLSSELKKIFNQINSRLFYQAISDTKDRYLRVLFFKEEASVLHATIKHKEKIGAFACISQQLSKNHFNIIASRSEISAPNEEASLHVTLQSIEDEPCSTDELKKRLLGSFQDPECLYFSPISIGFPHGLHPAGKYEMVLEATKVRKGTKDVRDEGGIVGLYEKLECKHIALENKTRRTGLNEQERRFLNLLVDMRHDYSAWTGKSLKKALFLSTHFSNKERLEQIKAIASDSDYGFEIVTGEQLEMFSDKTAGLIEKIKSATHFLGVWPSDKMENGAQSATPSPWLLWELGVANSNKLNWRLLISRSIDKDYWSRIDNRQQHVLYSESDFENGLRRTLRSLAQIAPQNYWNK